MSSGKQQSDKMIQMLVTFQLEPQPQSKDDIFDEDFRLSSHSRDILRHWLTPDMPKVQKRRPLPKRLSRLSANGTQEKKRPEKNKQEKKRVSEEEKKIRVSEKNNLQKKKTKAVSKLEE